MSTSMHIDSSPAALRHIDRSERLLLAHWREGCPVFAAWGRMIESDRAAWRGAQARETAARDAAHSSRWED